MEFFDFLQMCESQEMFLSWMNMIWDCYLHFVRHYGDFLPGVFDPLPFVDLPKVCVIKLYWAFIGVFWK